MLATRIVQKEGTFYFIAYKAADLLDRVSFTSRYYFEGEQIEADEPGPDLFELANSLAALLHAPVTIEDLSSRVIAFSASSR